MTKALPTLYMAYPTELPLETYIFTKTKTSTVQILMVMSPQLIVDAAT